AGAAVGGALGLPLSRSVVHVAEQAPRNASPRSAAARVRDLSREPRSGRQLRVRAKAAPVVGARIAPRPDGVAPARPVHAAAVPGPGVRVDAPVPLLRGSQR